jgi:hypothetical protein
VAIYPIVYFVIPFDVFVQSGQYKSSSLICDLSSKREHAVVVLASVTLAALIFSLYLVRKGHDSEEDAGKLTDDDSGHRVHLRGQA